MPESPRFRVESVLLHPLKMALQERIGPQLADSVNLERFVDHLTNEMVYRLTATVLAEKIESQRIERTETVAWDFCVPDGRLQRWKERHWDATWCRWLCFGRPVRYLVDVHRTTVKLVVDVEDYATFPHNAYIPAPDTFGPPVFQRMVRDHIDKQED